MATRQGVAVWSPEAVYRGRGVVIEGSPKQDPEFTFHTTELRSGKNKKICNSSDFMSRNVHSIHAVPQVSLQ